MKYLEDRDLTLHQGDVREVLRSLPDESVHCVVTSPPYWGLRDYAAEGQLGLELTPDEYVANIVEVFREVRRVLRKDGTCWLNMGDSYNANQGAGFNAHERTRPHLSGEGVGQKRIDDRNRNTVRARPDGLKPKDLCMIPARLALALQADGWYLRSQIVWSKPNPMPESVTDRPTTSHEFVYLLAKSPRYFFDQEAVREAFDARPQQRLTANVDMPLGAARIAAGVQQGNPQGGTHVSRFQVQRETLVCGCIEAGCGETFSEGDCGCACHTSDHLRSLRSGGLVELPEGGRPVLGMPEANRARIGRNLRSVWEIPTQPYPEAHFATYPEELVRRCILAGTSERGCCPECGGPWVREVAREKENYRPKSRVPGIQYPSEVGAGHTNGLGASTLTHHIRTTTTGWRPSCEHASHVHVSESVFIPYSPVPCTVLDPFFGSGTTGLVARKHERRTIGIELSPSYCELAARRLQQLSLLSESR